MLLSLVFSDNVFEFTQDVLTVKQHPVKVVIVTVLNLAKAGDQACRRACQYSLFASFPLSVTGKRPLNKEQIAFSWNCEAPPVSVPHSVWEPPLRALTASPWALQKGRAVPLWHREHLPVTFEAQAVVIQPLLDQQAELSQFPLVGAKYCEVVHVSGVVFTELALPD